MSGQGWRGTMSRAVQPLPLLPGEVAELRRAAGVWRLVSTLAAGAFGAIALLGGCLMLWVST